jgi:hypothetical protein
MVTCVLDPARMFRTARCAQKCFEENNNSYYSNTKRARDHSMILRCAQQNPYVEPFRALRIPIGHQRSGAADDYSSCQWSCTQQFMTVIQKRPEQRDPLQRFPQTHICSQVTE